MAKIMRYNLEDFNNITFDGFQINLPEDTLQKISEIALQVGSPTYIRTPVFNKKEREVVNVNTLGGGGGTSTTAPTIKKRRNRNNMESTNQEDWDTIRTFHSTKIEQKEGVYAIINNVRLNLNKLTDKNYSEFKTKIIELIPQNNLEEIKQIGNVIFEIASTNRFYSKMYADLYCELIEKFEEMKNTFIECFENFINLFNNIEYVDASVDYDMFCKNNKDNEKRKALSTFFLNLMTNGMLTKCQIINILVILLNQVNTYISQENKKNEVDEITENVAILYTKEIMDSPELNEFTVKNVSVSDFIELIANSKAKSYKSLTNKAIFKFMDMNEM
jgi:hypothetical protein